MEERMNKLDGLKGAGINPYPYRFGRTHTFRQIRDSYDLLSRDKTVVSTCGRVLTIRGHGKTIFATLADESDKMQISTYPGSLI
jgi:lysyl-tRNA synthetase class 2